MIGLAALLVLAAAAVTGRDRGGPAQTEGPRGGSYWMLDVNQELESSNPKGFFLPVDSSAKPTR
jgi:hypothetical protein